MLSRKLWPMLVILLPLCGAGSVNQSSKRLRDNATRWLTGHEWLMFKPAVYDAEFAEVTRANERSGCAQTQPPEALTTPNPLLAGSDRKDKVIVSFIVGTDGKVHSPLILEGGNSREEHLVLDAVRYWRYRPARCNGVPTEVEGKVEFSRR